MVAIRMAKPSGHISDVMKNNSLLYHHSHVEDVLRKSILQGAFVSNQESDMHSLHDDIQGFTMNLKQIDKKLKM